MILFWLCMFFFLVNCIYFLLWLLYYNGFWVNKRGWWFEIRFVLIFLVVLLSLVYMFEILFFGIVVVFYCVFFFGWCVGGVCLVKLVGWLLDLWNLLIGEGGVCDVCMWYWKFFFVFFFLEVNIRGWFVVGLFEVRSEREGEDICLIGNEFVYYMRRGRYGGGVWLGMILCSCSC